MLRDILRQSEVIFPCGRWSTRLRCLKEAWKEADDDWEFTPVAVQCCDCHDYNQQVGATAVIQRYRIKGVALVFGLFATFREFGLSQLAGVALEMEHVVKSAQAAILLVTFRMLGIFIACRVAIRLLSPSELPDSVSSVDIERQRNVAWMAHVTQAGVALGLASVLGEIFRLGRAIRLRRDCHDCFELVNWPAALSIRADAGRRSFGLTDANAVDGAQEE